MRLTNGPGSRRLAITILLLWAWAAAAQTSAPKAARPGRALAADLVKQFRHDVWTQNDGLSGGPVNAIAQTTDGHLWLGTGDGLVRFDGVNFTCFRRSNVPQLVDSEITALAADPAGGLWAGTSSGGVVHYVPGPALTAGKFEHFGSRDGLPDDRLLSLGIDPEGR